MRVVNVPFIGAKYSINSQLDVIGAFYYENQNNYNSSTTPCAYAKTSFVEPNGNVLRLSAKTAALAPARSTPFPLCWIIGRSSASISMRA